MGKIFLLLGKSSCGKDTLFRMLMEDQELSLKTIVSYTTRPMRAGETNGTEYYFCDEEKLDLLQKEGKVIELRAYDTIEGIWKYFTVDDGQIQLEEADYLFIGTLEVFSKLCGYFGKEHVVPIYVEVEDGVRLARALERERSQRCPNYEELCRRFLADSVDFSEEKLEAVGIKKRFYNRDLEETRCEIKDEILNLQQRG